MRFALIARETTPTNESIAGAIVEGVRWELLSPEEALQTLRPGDAALGRLDVLPTLDGIDDGMWALGALEARRVVVLNDAAALFATHDKLLTARLLRRAEVPHPRTAHISPDRPFPAVRPPVVVKPRFGSGGKGVTRCDDEQSLYETLALLSGTTWFEQQGVLVQELNGAVEFTSEYQPGGDVFSDVSGLLARHAFALLASRPSASAAA